MNDKSNSAVYYLSLGSNLGDRQANLQRAVGFLKGNGEILKVSSVYETEPVDMERETAIAPGMENFYNIALCFRSFLPPEHLLKEIKSFEQRMGRDMTRSHKRSRVIDIDILLAEGEMFRTAGGSCIIYTEDLVIPHREMDKRAFVLVPLKEIAADVKHPLLGKTVNEILADLKSDARIVILPSTVRA
jgi:2-amino-4-hydroxy-6-hydroxymethyldihydropteridine diphosphokinase